MDRELEREIIALVKRYVRSTQVSPRAGQQVDAAGGITYDFEGHIHADGLDLDEAQAAIPKSNNAVSWLDAAGGVAERIFGRTFPVGVISYLQMQANHLFERATGRVSLDAYGGAGDLAQLVCEAGEENQSVRANASGVEAREIVNNLGGSSFPQLPPGILASARRLSYGRVSGAGGVLSGDGFTVERLGVGSYRVNLEPERAIVPGVAVTPETAVAIPVFTTREIGKASFRVSIWNFGTGAAMDCNFAFVALG